MKKFKLQAFSDTRVQGKKMVYLFRVLSDAATKSGTTIAFTTENSRSKSKDADTVVTKDGSIRIPGTSEIEISVTAYLSTENTIISELEEAMDNDEKIEIWEANLQKPTTGNKFEGAYYQGYLTSIEYSSSGEDYVEVSLSFAIEGNGAKGSVTVTEEQQELANYAFRDTEATPGV